MTQSFPRPAPAASPEQTAEYTYDMLMALKKLALARGQETLVALLTAAAAEAYMLAQGRGDDRA